MHPITQVVGQHNDELIECKTKDGDTVWLTRATASRFEAVGIVSVAEVRRGDWMVSWRTGPGQAPLRIWTRATRV